MAVDFIMYCVVKPSNKCEVTANIFRNACQWLCKSGGRVFMQYTDAKCRLNFRISVILSAA